MGQTTRSQGISFTHEMWTLIEARCAELKVGRSRYFQMLVEWDMHFMTESHAHKADGKWHFYAEPGSKPAEREHLRAADEPAGDPPARRRRRPAR